jgi:hypothetical protein
LYSTQICPILIKQWLPDIDAYLLKQLRIWGIFGFELNLDDNVELKSHSFEKGNFETILSILSKHSGFDLNLFTPVSIQCDDSFDQLCQKFSNVVPSVYSHEDSVESPIFVSNRPNEFSQEGFLSTSCPQSQPPSASATAASSLHSLNNYNELDLQFSNESLASEEVCVDDIQTTLLHTPPVSPSSSSDIVTDLTGQAESCPCPLIYSSSESTSDPPIPLNTAIKILPTMNYTPNF